ncbi:glycoside hydrolase/phage tail family protein [Martelella lutilitoris]|uniref:Glycoside hydrolase/phage tail family protein n=1 Tax=Martelella lutilitoris TaxID=2583532 RepID=A0A7T7HHF8_9HYPH|nr:glycoside hydrolase/phage tail family protein [Martelella lutilitoris]QQM29217.1 glycoside hydrolase/phage tail family protein [Martelella lutilitoris]
MATILFQAAGAAFGSVLGPFGAVAGRALGALAGAAVDGSIFSGGRRAAGRHLPTARVGGAEEGVAIPRVYGASRVGGTLIWATRFEEDVVEERAGGKASGSTLESFAYYGNFAFGICEGPVAAIRRVWADGRELDLTGIEMRFYPGDDSQLPDPLIEAKQGAGNAPAYRGLCYVVFERLPLDGFGNRIPVIQFEVLKPTGTLESRVKAIAIIPGATEHGLCPYPVTESLGRGSQRIMNRNTLTRATDWEASIDELTALCPNLERVALVVTWFGSDLRAGECRILPGVETPFRAEESTPWSVSGLRRDEAHVVSTHEGGPAYGGTPNDAGLMAAIADLKARGLKVFLYPFIMMDVPAANGLPDPYGGAEQAIYPWRGRITCHPARGVSGSSDRTATARAQVEAFLGTAEPHHFTPGPTGVTFAGTDAGYRRLILHYAHLAAAAGGVDGVIIGSELKGLTSIRDQNDAFPFVEALIELAGDVRNILGPDTALTYGADWSEYFGFHPDDGSGNIYFNLDPLWASPDITAVGIDNYMPLSDWRDDDLASENPDGFKSATDPAGLEGQIAAGEGYDWHYIDQADRVTRRRTPITDGLADKPWVYRYKDLAGWWSNRHFDRIGGSEAIAPTAWVPMEKPIWFTELGCPAVDKGSCQPNVFADPKSAESAYPHFSSRRRSDDEQRRFLEAHLGHWSGASAPAGMVDPDHIFLWCWDIRPYPAFPQNDALWSDGANWTTGHWLNGRLGATTLADAVRALLADHGFNDCDTRLLSGDLTGYLQADIDAARDLIEPLLSLYSADCIETADGLVFRSRQRASLSPRVIDIVAERDADAGPWRETRLHGSDIPGEAAVTYFDPEAGYAQASARASRATTASDRVLRFALPTVLSEATALERALALLRESRCGMRTLQIDLSPQERALEIGDVFRLEGGPAGRFMVTRLEVAETIRLEARSFSPSVGTVPGAGENARLAHDAASEGFSPRVIFLDLARDAPGPAEDFARVAVFSRPFRRAFVASSSTDEGYQPGAVIDRPAATARLAAPLQPGASGRFDFTRALVVDLDFGGLASATRTAVLNGENRIAVRAVNGVFEIIGFLRATEISSGRWRLEGLLRGLHGTEDAMLAGAETGNDAVVLNASVVPVGLGSRHVGLSRNYVVETANGQADPRAPYQFAGGIRAETPLSPVHLKVRRLDSGDLAFSWVRRSRLDADDWAAADIPKDEDAEAYRLEIFAGATLLRSIETALPQWLYPEVDQLADFGASATHFSLRLRQLGRKVPLGTALVRTFSLVV